MKCLEKVQMTIPNIIPMYDYLTVDRDPKSPSLKDSKKYITFFILQDPTAFGKR